MRISWKNNLILLDILGADRYDIHLTKDRPLTVRDLMEEIERKSRVTISNQQLIFRGNHSSSLNLSFAFNLNQGQRLHEHLDETLQRFGVFNGNQIMLIGKKVMRDPLFPINRIFSCLVTSTTG